MINPQYASVEDFSNGLAFVSDQQSGYLDRTGKLIWSITDPNYVAPQTIASQNNAKDTIKAIHEAQQRYHARYNQFTPNLSDLAILRNGNDLATALANDNDYRYDMTLIGQGRVRLSVTPKREGLRSYVSSIANNGSQIKSITCQSIEPTQKTLAAPQMTSDQLKCATGSTSI